MYISSRGNDPERLKHNDPQGRKTERVSIMATNKTNEVTATNTNATDAAQEQIALMSRIAELEKMQAELKELKAQQKNKLRLKVSQKGAISVYGLQARFPITLYKGQWERVIAELFDTGLLNAFIAENVDSLSVKPEKKPAPAKATKW